MIPAPADVLFEGRVELRRLPIEHAAKLTPAEWLTEEEEQRHQRYRRQMDRDGLLLGRYLARQALAQVMGVKPAQVEILRTALGKPYVADGPDFSITHGGAMVAVALALSGSIGVDLEPVSRMDAMGALIHRVCTPLEAAWVENLGGTKGLGRLWCLKEAVLKATGQGLSVDPRDVAIHPETGQLLGLESKPALGWRLTTLAGPTDFICALALRL